jgi:membrane dipeptidase
MKVMDSATPYRQRREETPSAEPMSFARLHRRRGLNIRGLLVLLAAALTCTAQSRTVTDAEVMRVHRSAILIDSHNDLPTWMVDGQECEGQSPCIDVGKPTKLGHTDLARLRKGGVGAVFFAAYVSGNYVKGNRSAHRALAEIDVVRHAIVEKYPHDFMLATTAADIEQAHREGKIAALIGIEGGHAIEDDLGLLRDYYALGVRYMTLTHTNTNDWADSSGDINDAKVKHHGGLTPFGKQVVLEMNRLGMMVDISHVADDTFWDALKTSKAPIIASHSDCRALANAPRNLTDQMIIALAKKGGVVDINFNCGFLSQRFRDQVAAHADEVHKRVQQMEAAGRKLGDIEEDVVEGDIQTQLGIKRPALADVVDHIDHIRKIAGIDAIGIGTDFNGVGCTPVGLEDVSKFPNLTRALLEKGYSPEDIHKIYGGNFLRVMRAVEADTGK